MNSAMPLRAVDIAYEDDKQNEPAVLQHLQNPLSTNMKVLTSHANYSEITQEQKQKISGNYDGQVILTLPEMGVKILFADQELRQQYYQLRHKLFTEVDEAYREKHPEHCLNWEDYDGSESRDDRCGRILVAINEGGKVVAGLRFLLCDWIDYTANEVPEKNFTIRSFLQKFELDSNARFVELDDVIMLREYRGKTLMKMLYSVLIQEAYKFDCKYIIGVVIKVAARSYKMIFASLGYKVNIMFNYPWVYQKNHGYETRFPAFTCL